MGAGQFSDGCLHMEEPKDPEAGQSVHEAEGFSQSGRRFPDVLLLDLCRNAEGMSLVPGGGTDAR